MTDLTQSASEDKPVADERATNVQPVAQLETAQVMQFDDGNDPSWMVEPKSNLDPTFETGYNDGSADLADFLSRPVLLHTENIPISENLYRHQFKPWTLFFSDAAIRRKIYNFAYIKCNLHVKFVINASPFHYSLLMASYRPLNSKNPLGRLITINQTRSTVSESQMPNVLMEASTSTGGELVLPFVWPYNGLRIDKQEDFDSMGDIILQTITPLRAATATTTNVTISVFAWATDVTMSVSTSGDPFTAQSSKAKKKKSVSVKVKSDEYDKPGNGVVSGPASVVASISRGLEQAPLIGPFARATTIGADAVASIARIFGFSRPVTTCEITPYRNIVSGVTANTAGIDTLEKVSLDPKQELTIDPRTVGLDSTDQMTVNTIVSRRSFLTTFNWSETDAPGKMLFNSRVTPAMSRVDGTTIYPTALAFGSMPFKYWSGSLIFTFKIVATKYHKGRIVIHYDPFDNTIANVPSSTYSTSFSQTVDITENEEVEIEIPWAQMELYRILITNFGVQYYSDSAVLTPNLNDNGLLSVSVLNELTSSDDTSPIQIAVFVRAGDDFQLRVPVGDRIKNYVPFGANTEETMSSSGDFVAQSSGPKSIVHKSADSYNDDADHVVFGDPVHSFRSLLKRYNYTGSYNTVDTFADSEKGLVQFRMTQCPPQRGYYAYGMDTTSTGAKFNYVFTTLQSFLKPAYAGYRGGVRYKWFTTDGSVGNVAKVTFRYGGVEDLTTSVLKYTGTSNSQLNQTITDSVFTTQEGMSVTHQHTQQGLFYELPFYSNARFYFAGARDGVGRPENSSAMIQDVRFHYDPVAGTTQPSMEFYTAIGEDFSLFWFVAAPVMTSLASPTPETPP